MIKRRYKFNIIDHLHYMIGQDRLHNEMPQWQFSPLDAAIAVFIMWPMLCLCLIMPNDEMQIAWLVITVSAYLYGEPRWEKSRFTPARERAYYRRYPNRKNNCSVWMLIGINIAMAMVSGSLCLWFITTIRWMRPSGKSDILYDFITSDYVQSPPVAAEIFGILSINQRSNSSQGCSAWRYYDYWLLLLLSASHSSRHWRQSSRVGAIAENNSPSVWRYSYIHWNFFEYGR